MGIFAVEQFSLSDLRSLKEITDNYALLHNYELQDLKVSSWSVFYTNTFSSFTLIPTMLLKPENLLPTKLFSR